MMMTVTTLGIVASAWSPISLFYSVSLAAVPSFHRSCERSHIFYRIPQHSGGWRGYIYIYIYIYVYMPLGRQPVSLRAASGLDGIEESGTRQTLDAKQGEEAGFCSLLLYFFVRFRRHIWGTLHYVSFRVSSATSSTERRSFHLLCRRIVIDLVRLSRFPIRR
jgi:hypothetical protein